jgi:mono/diheme cytochrome c family protein
VVQLVSLVRKFRDGGHVVRDSSENDEDSTKQTEAQKPTAVPSSGSQSSQFVSQATIKPPNSQADSGRRVYHRFCVACHGADGHGSAMRDQLPTIPDFASPVWQKERSDAQLSTTIREGKGVAMPTFRRKLDDAASRDVVAYLRTLAPPMTPETQAPSTDFKERFRELQREMEDLKRQSQSLLAK